MPVLAVPGKPAVAGLFEAGFAGLADGLTSSVVFVVGGDIADAGVQPDGVVVLSDHCELGTQRDRVADREQVRVLGLDVPEEGCAARAEGFRSRSRSCPRWLVRRPNGWWGVVPVEH